MGSRAGSWAGSPRRRFLPALANPDLGGLTPSCPSLSSSPVRGRTAHPASKPRRNERVT